MLALIQQNALLEVISIIGFKNLHRQWALQLSPLSDFASTNAASHLSVMKRLDS